MNSFLTHLTSPRYWLTALLVSVFLLGYHEIWDRDTFFHLANGQALLAHGIPLPQNLFVWTHSSLPFYQNPAWLFGVVIAWLYPLGGLTAIVLLKCLLLIALFSLLFNTLRGEGVAAPAAVLTLFVVAMSSALRFNDRPEILTFFFFGLFLWLVQRFRRGDDRVLWAFPLVMILWANFHSGCIFGLLYLLVTGFGLAVPLLLRGRPAWMGGSGVDRSRLLRFALAVAATGAATFVTPTPLGNLRFLFQHLHVNEVVPIAEYGFPTPTLVPWFYLLLPLLVVLLWRQRLWPPVTILPMLVFLLLALSGVRFIPLFAMAALPAVAPGLARPLPVSFPRLSLRRREWGGTIFHAVTPLLLVLTVLFFPPVPGRHRVVVNPTMTPLAAFAFLDRVNAEGNLYNSLSYGAAGMFYLYPKYRLYQTSYIQVEEDLMADAYQSSLSAERWREFLDRKEIEIALIDTSMESPLPAFFPEEQWALLYFDDSSAIFMRRGGINQGLIDRFEYKVIHPFTFNANAGQINIDLTQLAAGVQELRRALASNPESSLAHLMLGYTLSLSGGQDDEAVQHFSAATRIKPDLAPAYYQQGILFRDLGALDMAATALETYIEMLPKDPQGYLQLAQIYARREEVAAAMKLLQRGLGQVSQPEELLHLLGNLYQREKNYEKAEECYQQALRITPAEPTLLNDYGVLHGLRGEHEKALQAFDAALAIRADYAAAARNRAHALTMLEQRTRNGGSEKP